MRMILNKGHRIRASDKNLVYRFSMGTLLFVFVAVILLLNTKQLMRTDWCLCIGRFSVLPLLLRQFQEAPAPSKAGKNGTGKQVV